MTDWISRWQDGKIGWHRDQVNTKLVDFIQCLKLNPGDSVFVPLCGKSVDMLYLLEQGFKVIGVELSPIAAEQFFTQSKIEYSIVKSSKFDIYTNDDISIYVGDYFDLDSSILSLVTAVYDRAALIALEIDLRQKYAQHLYSIIPTDCRVLLLTLNYPQSQMSGPPYALSEDEVKLLFNKRFEYQQLFCINDIENEPKFLRAGVDFVEKAAYCLHKK